MKKIIVSVFVLFAFIGSGFAINLDTMTIEKYEQIKKIQKHSDLLLTVAVQEGDIKKVQSLLEQGVDVNAYDGAENTALIAAVLGGHKDIVRLLLERGADPNVRYLNLSYSISSFGNGNKEIEFYQNEDDAPLSFAIKRGDKDIVQMLLENGADIEARYAHKETALRLAAAYKNRDIVKILLEYGADATVKGEYGTSILEDALFNIEQAVGIKMLEEMTKNEDLAYMLFSSGENKIVEQKIDQKKEAYKQEIWDMAELLIAAGADVNEKDNEGVTPLMEFSRKGDVEVVKFLLAHGAMVNLQDKYLKTALMYATDVSEYAENDPNLQVIKLLLENGAKVDMADEGGETALMIASRAKGGKQAIDLLLAGGAKVNKIASQNEGGTSLHNAYDFALAIYGDDKNVDALLENGADVNLGDEQGYTVLMNAVQNEDVNMVRKLLDKGADVNIKTTNFWGGTALMIAAENGYEELVRILLEHGADINARDNYKETALVMAVKKGYENIVQLLLENGAEVSGKSFYRETVLDCARKKGNLRIIGLLQSYGAK